MNEQNDRDSIRVLLVDDEEVFLDMIVDTLTPRGCKVNTAGNAQEAVAELESNFFDIVVLDVRMPGMNGLDLLRKLGKERPTQQVIMLTGHGSVSMAVEAMRAGAFDFLLKPVEMDSLLKTIKQAAERGRLQRRNIVLEEELERTRGGSEIVGQSPSINKVHDFINIASSSDLPVLITGETGTGKELVAQSIHAKSKRAAHSLVVVDGSILREELLASELFGHEKGAFTGAMRKKVGLFEVADRGSIFIDEIGEMSSANQSSLLRVIESGNFRPVGGVREVSTDVRIIVATNKDIKKAVSEDQFREDLFYRLNGLAITIAPLRERKSDIPLLVDHFLKKWNASSGRNVEITSQALSALIDYSWPGNIRELKYVVERSTLLVSADQKITTVHLPEDIAGISHTGAGDIELLTQDNPTLADLHQRYERSYIEKLMKKFKGNKSKVSRVLDISRSVLYEKLDKWGIS